MAICSLYFFAVLKHHDQGHQVDVLFYSSREIIVYQGQGSIAASIRHTIRSRKVRAHKLNCNLQAEEANRKQGRDSVLNSNHY